MNNLHLSTLPHEERFGVITEMARLVIPEPASTASLSGMEQKIDSAVLAAAVALLFFPELSPAWGERLVNDTGFFIPISDVEDCIRGTAALYREGGDMQWTARVNACAYFLRDWRPGLDAYLQTLKPRVAAL